MSALTKGKLASVTLDRVDDLLQLWVHAIERGDVTIDEVTPCVDELLDVRGVVANWVPRSEVVKAKSKK